MNILLEYMDMGSLADLLKTIGNISEVITGMLAYQVYNEYNKYRFSKALSICTKRRKSYIEILNPLIFC